MPSVEITTMIGCPLMCTFCPQDRLKGAYGDAKDAKYLSLPNFRTILAKIPRHVRIDFSGMAEPWANPDATTMLRETLEDGRPIAIYTTLYGMDDHTVVLDLLRKHAEQIEVLCLHLPDRHGNMNGYKHSVEYETRLMDFLGLAVARVLPRVEIMCMDYGGDVHPSLAHLGIKLGAFVGHTRAGNIEPVPNQPTLDAPRHAAAVTCSFTPYYDQNVVLPNGAVVLCCMDYGKRHRLGNLLEQSYDDLFTGAGIAALRLENMKPRFSERSLCKSCNRAVPHRQAIGNALMWQVAQ